MYNIFGVKSSTQINCLIVYVITTAGYVIYRKIQKCRALITYSYLTGHKLHGLMFRGGANYVYIFRSVHNTWALLPTYLGRKLQVLKVTQITNSRYIRNWQFFFFFLHFRRWSDAPRNAKRVGSLGFVFVCLFFFIFFKVRNPTGWKNQSCGLHAFWHRGGERRKTADDSINSPKLQGAPRYPVVGRRPSYFTSIATADRSHERHSRFPLFPEPFSQSVCKAVKVYAHDLVRVFVPMAYWYT